jgi:hypothetical protein
MFGNGQMLVMRTIEDSADPICQLVSREQPGGLYDLALAMGTHLGSMELSQGLLMGKRQLLMILTPWPLLLTFRL